jgi:hypothetical protein
MNLYKNLILNVSKYHQQQQENETKKEQSKENQLAIFLHKILLELNFEAQHFSFSSMELLLICVEHARKQTYMYFETGINLLSSIEGHSSYQSWAVCFRLLSHVDLTPSERFLSGKNVFNLFVICLFVNFGLFVFVYFPGEKRCCVCLFDYIYFFICLFIICLSVFFFMIRIETCFVAFFRYFFFGGSCR